MGYEPPEVARSLLQRRYYNPRTCSDVWALGQLMLQTAGGAIPEAQWQLQNSKEFLEERAKGCVMYQFAPAYAKYLDYLARCLSSKTDYADEVRRC